MGLEISLGSATSAVIAGNTTPEAVIADIQGGRWSKQVAAVRAATGDERDRLKKQLPAVLWSGTFSRRANAGLIQRSGLICADLDKIPERVAELHDIARHDPHTVAAFVSPTGTGLKIVFRAGSFNAVRSHVALIYGAKVDEAAKDVARLCFVSHDPAAFYNSEAFELPAVENPAQLPPVAAAGGRNNACFELACECRDTGQTPAEAEEAVLNLARRCSPPLPEAEAMACVKSAFSQPPRFRERPLPAIVDAAAFIAEPIAPPAELVAGILHKGSKLAFGGSSKSFKTWNLLDLAISVSAGVPWLGFSTAQGKVLFVNFEIQPHAWQRRLIAVADAKQVEFQAGRIHLWNLRGHAADFRRLIPKIIERCKGENFALIVLDPIYKLYGGTDENAAGDVAALLNEIERLATETSAAVAFGAHFAKGNASTKEAIDRISGSGVFARDPDSLLIFTRHEEDGAFTVEPILRNFAPVEPFAVRWHFPLMHLADDLDPAKLKQAGRKPEHTPEDLMKLLPPGGLKNAEWLSRANDDGISRRTFFRLRKALENDRKILLSAANDRWQPILAK